MSYGQAQYYPVERKVGVALALGIFLLPFVFAWFVLAPGYSARFRWLSFGWLMLPVLFAIMFSGHDGSAPAVQPASVPAEGEPLPTAHQLAQEEAAIKLDAADHAEQDLRTAHPRNDEDTKQFNVRVTTLYNRWIAAETEAEGRDWQQAYISRHTPARRNCNELYGRFIHEDEQIRLARLACAAQAYVPAPTVPTLADFLIKPEAQAVPADDPQTDSTNDLQPVSAQPEQVVTASQGQ